MQRAHTLTGEAEHLQFISEPMMTRSIVAVEGQKVSEARTSYSAFMGKKHDKVVQCIEERASKLTDTPGDNMEGLQVVYVY